MELLTIESLMWEEAAAIIKKVRQKTKKNKRQKKRNSID